MSIIVANVASVATDAVLLLLCFHLAATDVATTSLPSGGAIGGSKTALLAPAFTINFLVCLVTFMTTPKARYRNDPLGSFNQNILLVAKFCAAKQHFLLWGMVIIQVAGYQTAQNDYSRLVGYLSSSGVWHNMALWLSKASIFCAIQGYPAGRQSWTKVTKCGIYALMCFVVMGYRCQTETVPPHRPLTCSVQRGCYFILCICHIIAEMSIIRAIRSMMRRNVNLFENSSLLHYAPLTRYLLALLTSVRFDNMTCHDHDGAPSSVNPAAVAFAQLELLISIISATAMSLLVFPSDHEGSVAPQG